MKKNNVKIITSILVAAALLCFLTAFLCACKTTVKLNKDEITIAKGEEYVLELEGGDDSVIWKSSDENVATIKSGRVSGIKEGVAEITAVFGNAEYVCRVTVTNEAKGVPSLKIDAKKFSVYKGFSLDIKAIFKIGIYEKELPDGEIRWYSDDEKVLSVYDGKIEGKNVGKAVVTARCSYGGEEYSDSVEIDVIELLSLDFQKENDVIATSVTYAGNGNENGSSCGFSIYVVDENGERKLDSFENIDFVSSDEDVAIVREGRIVGGKKAGRAEITVNYKNAEGEIIAKDVSSVTVKTAMNSKKDFDMLALAFARGVNKTAWGKDSYYILTRDVDYKGEIWIPLACSKINDNAVEEPQKTTVLSPVWKEMFGTGNEYGISYEEFRKTGLNGEALNNVLATVAEKSEQAFQGTLDGNGYKISNAKLMFGADLRIINKEAHGNTNFVGFLGKYGVVKNLTLDNISFQSYEEAFGNVTEFDKLGDDVTVKATRVRRSGTEPGLFGFYHGTIKDCKFSFTNSDTLPNTVMQAAYVFLYGGSMTSGRSENVIIDVSDLGNFKQIYSNLFIFRAYNQGISPLKNVYVVSSVEDEAGKLYMTSSDGKMPDGFTVLSNVDELKAITLPTSFVNWEKTVNELPSVIKNVTLKRGL